MKRRQFLQLMAAPAILSATGASLAQGKQKVTYLYLLDPVYDAALWALRNGKVTSNLIEVEATGANIPTLLQATATKQYDVVMTAVIGLPAAAARGLELRILSAALYAAEAGEGGGVWVKKDSPLKDAAELKGKTLGSYGLRSTGYTQVRFALHYKHGLNAALEGGDIKQIEIQAPNLPGALAAGQIDAATLIHSQAYRAKKSGEFRVLVESGRDNIDMFKTRFVSAVNIAYPERLAQKPEAYREFNRMFRDSARYVLANRAEVFAAVGKQSNLDPDFFEWWFGKSSDVPGIFADSHADAITRLYELSKEMAIIPNYPDIRKLVWEHALRA
jgi:NitT/TauT family transport system substrate-binding protein